MISLPSSSAVPTVKNSVLIRFFHFLVLFNDSPGLGSISQTSLIKNLAGVPIKNIYSWVTPPSRLINLWYSLVTCVFTKHSSGFQCFPNFSRRPALSSPALHWKLDSGLHYLPRALPPFLCIVAELTILILEESAHVPPSL